MRLDIRVPIGLLFAIFGVMLTIYGMVSDKTIYARSLGININIRWGVVLILFGLVMLGLARMAKKPVVKS